MSQLDLFKKRKFFPLFWTQFFGAFNDNFFKNSLVILVTFHAQTVMGLPTSQIVALAGGIFILPFFLFSALAGQIADKFEKTKIIKWVKWAEVLIMLFAVLGFATENFPVLLFVLFLMGLQSTFFGPIKYSILPQHLTLNEMVGGNALIEAGTFLAILLGTICGGVLIAGDSGPTIVSFGVILVALLGVTSCYWIPHAPAVAPELKLQLNPIPPTFEMFRFAKKTKSVYLSILGISWFWFFGAALLSLFPPLCKDILQGSETLVTLFLSVFSVGIAIGSLLCERLSRKRLELGLVPLGSIGMSVFGVLLFYLCQGYEPLPAGFSTWDFVQSSRGLAILIDLFALSMFGGLFIVPMYTMMQERSDFKQRSRVIAANNVMNALFMVVASLFLSALLYFEVSIPVIILIVSILNMLVATYIYTLLPEFLLRFMAWALARLIYRIEVRGLEHTPKEGAAVLICNHISFVDWLILSAGIPRPIRFVMDKSFFKGRFRKIILRGAKVIPIASAKDNPEMMNAAFLQVRQELLDGELVCIFPEGKITKTGELNPFRPGILRIVEETPVPIIPMALNGLWGSFFSRKDMSLLKKRPRKLWARIELEIGEPVPPTNVRVDELRNAVAQLLKENN